MSLIQPTLIDVKTGLKATEVSEQVKVLSALL